MTEIVKNRYEITSCIHSLIDIYNCGLFFFYVDPLESELNIFDSERLEEDHRIKNSIFLVMTGYY